MHKARRKFYDGFVVVLQKFEWCDLLDSFIIMSEYNYVQKHFGPGSRIQ